jgi:anti-sigma factor RsiW
VSLLPTTFGPFGGGHLGARVSALLDGQLSAEDSERAWEHLARCRACQQEVERESWIKRRVAGLTYDAFSEAPSSLKGDLLGAPRSTCFADPHESRRLVGLALIGGGALGAAVMGFVAFGVGPADAPTRPHLVSYHTPQTTQSAVVYGIRP